MNCKNCGNIIPEGQMLCPVCGTDNNPNTVPVAPVPDATPINNVPDMQSAPVETLTETPVTETIPQFDVPAEPASEVATEVTPVNIVPDAPSISAEMLPQTPAVEEVPQINMPAEPIPEAAPEVAPISEPVLGDMAANQVPVVEQAATDTPAVETKPKKNKSFIIIVIILALIIIGLGVGIYFKKFKSNSSSSGSSNSNTNKTNNKKDKPKEIVVEPIDPTEIPIDEPKNDDPRIITKDDPITPTDNPVVQDDPVVKNPDPTVDPTINPTKGEDIAYNTFTYGNIKFRIPTYVTVYDGSDGLYYLTDNETYMGGFVLLQGNFETDIKANPTGFLTNLFTNNGLVPIDISFATIEGVNLAYVNYKAADENGSILFLGVGTQALIAFDIAYMDEDYFDYLIADLTYMAKYNEVLGTFSKDKLKSLGTFRAHKYTKPNVTR